MKPSVGADDEKRTTHAGNNINNRHGKLFQVIIVTDKNAHADTAHNQPISLIIIDLIKLSLTGGDGGNYSGTANVMVFKKSAFLRAIEPANFSISYHYTPPCLFFLPGTPNYDEHAQSSSTMYNDLAAGISVPCLPANYSRISVQKGQNK